jgi:pimeloyl-ACP methyl ester carboxylesterase
MTLTDTPRLPARARMADQPGSTDALCDRTITLADGRRLGYREYGPVDGRPVLFFHGLGTSRVICPYDPDLAERLGIRLIAVDRPGIGLSDRRPARKLLDFPADVAALASALNLTSLAVVGWSGGGPYAAACAYQLPDLVSSAALVSAPAPIAGVGKTDYAERLHRTAARAAGRAPWMIRLALWHWGRPQRRDAEVSFDRSIADMCRADREVLADAAVRQQMIDNSAELYRQGGRGMYEEAIILVRPWGFDPAEIKVPVKIFHGETDETVPPAMARHMARIVPDAVATFYPDEGHHLLYRRWPQILAALA